MHLAASGPHQERDPARVQDGGGTRMGKSPENDHFGFTESSGGTAAERRGRIRLMSSVMYMMMPRLRSKWKPLYAYLTHDSTRLSRLLHLTHHYD